MDDDLVTLREYLTFVEAEWARSVLAAAGICCLIPDSTMGYLYNVAGPVRVQVPASWAEEADRILSGHEFSRRSLTERLLSEEPDEEQPTLQEADREEAGAVERVPEGTIDPHDLCPVPPPPACPNCGSRECEETKAPPYAGESALAGAVKRFLGRGWLRCTACGHTWEE